MFAKRVMLLIFLIFEVSHGQSCRNELSFANYEDIDSGRFALDLNFINSDTVSGLQLPITFNNTQISIFLDSVSFLQGRCTNFALKSCEIDSSKKASYIILINNIDSDSSIQALPPGAGMLARIHFSYDFVDSLNSEACSIELDERNLYDSSIESSFECWNSLADDVDCCLVPYIINLVEPY